jgi:hypothetical protein
MHIAVIALEAGCLQRPKPGMLLRLNGGVFSLNLIENIRDNPKGAGSNSLTPGVIAGVTIGIFLAVTGPFALFVA